MDSKPAMDALPLLQLRNVAKSYGSRPVFRGVTFKLMAGEIIFLSGPNGSGKSTLLRVIAGLSRLSAGELELNLARPERGGGIGYLAHQTALYPQLTAWENLLFWSRLHKIAPSGGQKERERLTDALRRVGLEKLAREKAGILSRGQAQRLSLARLLLPAPALLLLDEPDTGLDGTARALLEREVAAAAERGAGVIRVGHRQPGAEEDDAGSRRAELRPERSLRRHNWHAWHEPPEPSERAGSGAAPC